MALVLNDDKTITQRRKPFLQNVEFAETAIELFFYFFMCYFQWFANTKLTIHYSIFDTRTEHVYKHFVHDKTLHKHNRSNCNTANKEN